MHGNQSSADFGDEHTHIFDEPPVEREVAQQSIYGICFDGDSVRGTARGRLFGDEIKSAVG